MAWDFDAIIDRSNTHSIKYDKYRDTKILPLWVADMDFRSPEPIVEALIERARHGVFGYTEAPDELIELIVRRLAELYDWQIAREDLVFLPGVVPALNLACRAFTRRAERVISLVPIYPPFMSAPEFSERALGKVPAVYDKARATWGLPFDALDTAMRDDAGLFLLCNPYNPVGRCLTRDEIECVVDICRQNDVVICSDEIHCDLLFDGRQHIPTATISREAAEITVTLMAPSKTFNLAGFGGSFAVIQNPELREKFERARQGIMPSVNIMAYVAMLSAYRDCEDWYRALIGYLQKNRDYLYERLNDLPGISMNRVEATYLAWLDVSALGLEDAPAFFESIGIGMSEGYRFGDDRFMRLNFGCSRRLLEETVRRFEKGLAD